MSGYIVERVLGNNIVQCKKSGEQADYLVQGKGLGFHRKCGDVIPPEQIEKVYFQKDTKKITQYLELVERCEPILVESVEEIITRMEARFGTAYDEYIHIALLDHLNFSLYRLRNGIEINNIFLDEYRVLYADEYAFAAQMAAYINDRLHVTLPESEIGFITLHFHSALHKESASKSALYMQIIADSIALIEEQLQEKLDRGSLERMRLVIHLKFALQRAEQKIELNNPVLEPLKDQYPEVYAIAVLLAKMLYEKFGLRLQEGELGYLVLHIQNIVLTYKTQGKES